MRWISPWSRGKDLEQNPAIRYKSYVRPFRFPTLVGFALVMAFLLTPCVGQQRQSHQLDLNFDSVIALHGLWDLSQDEMAERCPGEGFSTNPFFFWLGKTSEQRDRAVFTREPFQNVKVNTTVFGGAVPVAEAMVDFREGKAARVRVVVSGEDKAVRMDAGVLEKSRKATEQALSQMLKAAPAPRTRFYGSKGDQQAYTMTWSGAEGVACLTSSSADQSLSFVLAPPGTDPDVLANGSSSSGTGMNANKTELFCNFDALLKLPQLWDMTPDALEKVFGIAEEMESPYFRWLTTGKDTARFSRRPFSNVEVDLTLFQRRVPVDEALIDFKDGKVSQVTLSLYNRGDSGEISPQDFDARYKLAGQSLIGLLGVKPAERRPSAQTAVKTTGWFWSAPAALALLEYNADAMSKRGGAEFLRLKIAPVAGREKLLNIAAIGQSSTALTRSALPKFVKKEANGDVYVSGVPMVDQGDKGYCVVASCQRLFGYLHIPVDQYELAQVAASDADRGTSSGDFFEAMNKIDSKFNVRFKPLLEKSPMSASGDRNARPDRFAKMIQEEIDKGMPLLWALELGLFPEEPSIAMQAGGGHMRLIIGYNLAKQELLFTDSWGAGHELKRMKMADAVRASFGVYLIEPKAR